MFGVGYPAEQRKEKHMHYRYSIEGESDGSFDSAVKFQCDYPGNELQWLLISAAEHHFNRRQPPEGWPKTVTVWDTKGKRLVKGEVELHARPWFKVTSIEHATRKATDPGSSGI